jgi:hypothetical protein
MDIAQIWMSQKKLRRAGQIPTMIEALEKGDELPRITLVRCEDGEVQVHDGHHRLTAYWLAGRSRLDRHEYILLEQDHYHRPRCGKVERLLKQGDTRHQRDEWGRGSGSHGRCCRSARSTAGAPRRCSDFQA